MICKRTLGPKLKDKLSRGALHRYLQRHGISACPVARKSCLNAAALPTPPSATYILIRVDSGEVPADDGKCHLFLAVDRVTKFAYGELHPQATMLIGTGSLEGVLAAFAYTIYTVEHILPPQLRVLVRHALALACPHPAVVHRLRGCEVALIQLHQANVADCGFL